MSQLSEFLDKLTGAGGGGGTAPGISAPINMDIKTVVPPWADKFQGKTLPAFGPGQQQMMANQLAFGGFGTPTTNNTWLGQNYRPTQSFNYGPGKVVAPSGADGTTNRNDDATGPTYTYTRTNFPWQAYVTANPGIARGPNTTADAEGARAWADYIAKGGKWKAPTATGGRVITDPVGGGGGVVAPSALPTRYYDNSYAARRQRGETNQR